MQRLTTFHRTGVDSQAIVLVSDTAYETLAELGIADVDEPSGGLRGIGEGDRGGRVEVQLRDPSLCHHRVTVEQDGGVAVPFHGERTLERRRQAKSDFDRVALEKRGKTPRCISAVRRRQGPPETACERELHSSGLY